jgi:heptosyltransferase-3
VAVNTPVVVLFGPSGEHMWGPLGDQHRVITRPYDCRPCGVDGCNGSKRSRCLEEIRPAEVIEQIDAQISGLNLPERWNISPAL